MKPILMKTALSIVLLTTKSHAQWAVALWGTGNVPNGQYSVTGGVRSTTTGYNSIAFGYENAANGTHSTAFGVQSTASGSISFVQGFQSLAWGEGSIAMGQGARAHALNSVAVGPFPVARGNPTTWVATDPVFTVANGQSDTARSNALVVLKSGAVLVKPAGDLSMGSFTAGIKPDDTTP